MGNNIHKIIVPIEIHQREYFAKLWLSCELASRGHEVYIGDITATDYCLNDVQPDIYLSNLGRIDRDQTLHDSLFVAVLDAEGGIFRSVSDYKKRLESRRFDLIDAFFVWGKPQKRLLEELDYEGDVIVTGNPRFALLQDELNQVMCDGENGSNSPTVVITTNDVDDNSPQFVSNVQTLMMEFPKVEFVIRPHPSEDWSKYAHMGKKIRNLRIEPEGAALCLTLGAAAVIHQNSTAGLEACISGTPTISHDPDGRISGDEISAAREISFIADDLGSLRDALCNVLDGDFETSSDQPVPKYIDLSVNPVGRIAQYFDEVEVPNRKRINQSIPLEIKFYHSINKLAPPVVSYNIRYLLTRLGVTNSANRFPFLSAQEVQKDVTSIAQQKKYDNIQINHVSGYEALFVLRDVR